MGGWHVCCCRLTNYNCAENLAALASIAGCAAGNVDTCAVASFGSNYAFTYDFGKASRAAAISYYSAGLYEYVGGITEGAYLANAVANGFVGGIAAELDGGDFGDGFLSAGVSALAKPYIRGIGTDQYSGSRVAARTILGGTISELTGGKFANEAVSAAMAQMFNAEKTREVESLGLKFNEYDEVIICIGADACADSSNVADASLKDLLSVVVAMHPAGKKAQKFHGNSKRSNKPKHLYSIIDTRDGSIYKLGISGGALNANGSSKRANLQANALNRQFVTGTFKSNILPKGIPGRLPALALEYSLVYGYAATNGQKPIGNKKP
ncbi:MAG: hypothetical protein ACI8RW_001277 [Porticoccaceae bacterium]